MAQMSMMQQFLEMLPRGRAQSAQSESVRHEDGQMPTRELLAPEGLFRPEPWPVPEELLDEPRTRPPDPDGS
jgi:hypothetical protein